jgi:hypothetical protein
MTDVPRGVSASIPRPKVGGWLLVLTGDRAGDALALVEGPGVFGREKESCESWRVQAKLPPCSLLVLSDPVVSRVHALFDVGPAGVTVRDLRSANKTLLGKEELTPMKDYPLRDRDRITIATTHMMYIRNPGSESGDTLRDMPTRAVAKAAAAAAAAGQLAAAGAGDGADGKTVVLLREQLRAAEKLAKTLEQKVSKLLEKG